MTIDIVHLNKRSLFIPLSLGRQVMAVSRIKEEAALRDLLRWIESRDLNMTSELREEREEAEDSVRWLSYILDSDETENGEIQ